MGGSDCILTALARHTDADRMVAHRKLDRRPREFAVENSPNSNRALLRLSAMISQYPERPAGKRMTAVHAVSGQG